MFHVGCFEYAFCHMDSVGQCGIGITGNDVAGSQLISDDIFVYRRALGRGS